MRFQPGQSGNPGGLKKGIRKKSGEIKLAMMEAFEKLGGVDGLVKWALKYNNKKEFYRLLIQLLPKDLDVEVSDELYDRFKNYTAEQLKQEELKIARELVATTASNRQEKVGESA